MTDVTKLNYVAPWVRVGLLILGALSVAYLAWRYTGSVIPEDPKDALIFQNCSFAIRVGGRWFSSRRLATGCCTVG